MSKRIVKQPRRFWSKKEEEFLIECMRDLINDNAKWKLDCGQFKAGFYGECEKMIIRAFPGTNLRANPHIDSKIKTWRKQYHVLQDMLKLSGFGWDDKEKMITVFSDDVWESFVRSHPDAKGMRNKPHPYFEEWLHLFGIDRATGDLAEGPAETVAAMDREAATEELGDESPTVQFDATHMDFSMLGAGTSANVGNSLGGQSSPAPSSSNLTGKKRGRVADGLSKGLSDMAEAFGGFFADNKDTMAMLAKRIGYAQDLSEQRRQVNAELMDHPLDWNQRLRAATMIVQEPQHVDLFFSFPKEDQVGWVALLLAGALNNNMN